MGAGGVRVDAQAAFVHLPVMEAAQGRQVGQLRLAALGPVMHLVPVDVPAVRAAGEDAPFVA